MNWRKKKKKNERNKRNSKRIIFSNWKENE